MAKRKTSKTSIKTAAAEPGVDAMPSIDTPEPALEPLAQVTAGEGEAASEPIAVSDAVIAEHLDRLAAEFPVAQPSATLAPEIAAMIDGSSDPAPASESGHMATTGANPTAAEKAAHGWPLGKGWFSLTAASVALAAVLGVTAGVLIAPIVDQPAPIAAVATTAPNPSNALQESVRLLAAEIASLKKTVASSESGSADALARFTERLETNETMQGALVERVTKLAETLEARPVTAVSAETTGSIEEPAPVVARGWVLWRVTNGRALVQGNGGYYEVMAGSNLPGLGVVQKITRNDGRWVVMTQKGMIIPPRG